MSNPKKLKALLVYPKDCSPSYSLKRNEIPLGLLTVASCLPSDWDIRFLDANVDPVNDSDLYTADLVFTGGMNVHRKYVSSLIENAKRFNRPVIVGGPDVTDCPELYKAADHLVCGEAELCVTGLVQDLEMGTAKKIYDVSKSKTHLNTSPIPKYELINQKNYTSMSVQFGRGCPFLCDFCGVPQRLGRVPRTKEPHQIMSELQRLYDLGHRGAVHCVDDNLIGNKKRIKEILRDIRKWQEPRGYPFHFDGMVTFNAADDEPLLLLLRQAGFTSVFIGIESSSQVVLESMGKIQNSRRVMKESIAKFYQAGLSVETGFILGNDLETKDTADEIIECIKENDLLLARFSVLLAEPHTALTKRLESEKRLLWKVGEEKPNEWCLEYGLNFIPTRKREEILKDLVKILETVYQPRFFFARLDGLLARLNVSFPGAPGEEFEKQVLANGLRSLSNLFLLLSRLGKHPLIFLYFIFYSLKVLYRFPSKLGLLMQNTFFCLDRQTNAKRMIQDAKSLLASLASPHCHEILKSVHSGPPRNCLTQMGN